MSSFSNSQHYRVATVPKASSRNRCAVAPYKLRKLRWLLTQRCASQVGDTYLNSIQSGQSRRKQVFPSSLPATLIIESMAARDQGSDLASFLVSVLSLPADQRTTMSRGLSPKFALAISSEGGTLSESLAIGLLQCFAVAKDLENADYLRHLEAKLHLSPAVLPTGEAIFSADYSRENRELIQQVAPALAGNNRPVEDMLKDIACEYLIRVRQYSLSGMRTFTSTQYTCRLEDKEKYLTVYLFVNIATRKSVVLVPCKYRIAITAPDKKLKEAVFLSTRQVEPPQIDRSLHETHRVVTSLLELVQNFSKPMLKYCVKLLERIEETKDTLPLTGGDLSTARNSLRQMVQDLQGSDFGEGGEVALGRLKELLAKEETGKQCDFCGELASDVTLACGHNFCSRCVKSKLPEDLLNIKGELKAAVPCLHTHACPTGTIKVEDLRRMDERFFRQRLLETEERCSARLCAMCKRIHNKSDFQQLACGHFMCNYCLGTKYSIELMCPECGRGVFKADLNFDALTQTCFGCKQPFYFKHTLNLTCVVPYQGDFYPSHQDYCNACIEKCLKYGYCCENHRFSEEEKEYIAANCFFQTDCHNQPTALKDLLQQTSCEHRICRECVQNQNLTSCPRDRIPFNAEALPKCAECDRPPATIELRCTHFLHEACVERLAQRWESKNWAACPKCGMYISPSFLLPLVRNNVSAASAFNEAFGYSLTFKCPLPSGTTTRLYPTALGPAWHQCGCHRQYFCTFCFEPYTADTEHNCHYLLFRQHVDSMLENGQEVMQCPECQVPEQWKADPFHQCTKCQKYYAPCCVAFYEPIYYHGPGWHRPNCVNFSNVPEPDGASGCSACQRSRVKCPKPKQLQRPRLIGPGEAEKLV